MPISVESLMERDALVYGRDGTSGVIGCGLQGTDRIRVFRKEKGQLVSDIAPFEPFLLLTDEDRLKGWRGNCRMERLAGRARFRRLVFFPDLVAWDSARRYLHKRSGGLGGPEAPYSCFEDPVHQYLLVTGRTHFQGLRFGDLQRMQIDLETYCHPDFEFPNARRESDRITAIAMSDTTGWERVLSGRELCEAEMLEAMMAEIHRRDPDVIEGHNFFRFDLNYLLLRAERYGMQLSLGRDGSTVKGRPARLEVGGRRLNFINHEIFGRHVIDTWFLAQLHGMRTGELDRYGLKALALHFGVASDGRTYIPGDRASWYFDHDPDTLLRYAMDDVRETRAVSNLLSPLYFFEAQIFPYSYQGVGVTSEAVKLDALVVREYLASRQSIPEAVNEEGEAPKDSEVGLRGRAENVLRYQTIGLHAAIMSSSEYCPRRDELQVLPRFVRKLAQQRQLTGPVRLHDERSVVESEDFRTACETILGALPSYLMSAGGRFNDFEVGAQIARKARETVASLARCVEQSGGRPIEIDDSGFYFSAPPSPSPPWALAPYVEELVELLPEGAGLHVNGPYPAMFVYDAENYVLLDRAGQVSVIGTHLRPPGIERFQRECLEEMLGLLLEGREQEIPGVYERCRQALQSHAVDISLLSRTETLQESLEEYQMRLKGARRRPRGIYEVALRTGRPYLEGDKLSFYVTGEGANVKVSEHCRHVSEWNPSQPDENIDYYKARLRELYEKLRPFIAEESWPKE